ncbi:MAG: FtsW/RodA/SpoVE family cell cycle protein [Defluviitaleaceae bacterium]|nr:FtsW/RodA/SpoVE family cell cycle protein [Defluviitaleaceae bacterium]
MRSLDRINDYVNLVCRQIRWKKAHNRISEEMLNHITDGRDSYIARGLDEQAATEKAIADTGDAMIVGTEFDRVHRPKPQWSMFAWVAGFLLLGIFISVLVFDGTDISRRLLWTAIGAAVMLGAYFADFTLLGKYPKRVFFGAALTVWAVFFFYPWFDIGPITVHLPRLFESQPLHTTQVLALILPIAFVPVIYIAKNKKYWGLISSLLAYGLLCLIAFSAPALSGFVHFAIIGMVLLIIAVLKNWFGVNRAIGILLVFVPYVIILAFMIVVYAQGSWIATRISAVLNPHSDPMGFGFVAIQVRELLNNAVLFGEGAAPVVFPQAWFYSDFILATVINRFGWLAFAIFMGVLLLFMGIVISRCTKQKSGLGFFASIAIALTFFVQIFMYVIFNLGFTITHISLPLISPGNFAMVINMGLIGFMLSVFRTGDAFVDKNVIPSTKQSDIFSWHNGKLTINFKMKAE